MGMLDGKVAIITGGASGQGAAEARLFAAEGAKVVIADIQDELGGKLAAEIGESAIFVHLDVSSEDDWAEVIRQATQAFGDPTILVQSAAIVHHKLIEDSTRAEFDRVLAVNLVGPFLGMLAVLPGMRRAGGGVIVNVGSGAALSGVGGRPLYGAAKWGLRGLTKSAAIEFGLPRHPGELDPARRDRHSHASPQRPGDPAAADPDPAVRDSRGDRAGGAVPR